MKTHPVPDSLWGPETLPDGGEGSHGPLTPSHPGIGPGDSHKARGLGKEGFSEKHSELFFLPVPQFLMSKAESVEAFCWLL